MNYLDRLYGVRLGQVWARGHRSRRRAVGTVILFALMLGLLAGWTGETVPVEDITVEIDGEVTVTRGFVLDDSGTWMTVLEMDEREIVYLPSVDVAARVWVDE